MINLKIASFSAVGHRCLLGVAVLVVSMPDQSRASYFTVPESELLDSEFSTTAWGGSVTRTDAPNEAVDFALSGLSGSSTGLKDDYPVAPAYGQILPSHGNGDFSNFSGYVLQIQNLDADPVSVSLFINTGFTGPSGTPSSNIYNDTFWQSPWTDIAAGQTSVLRLDFDNAIPYNIEDNPSPHTQGSEGVATSINGFDRMEVSAIGFQALGPGGNTEATIRVSPIPEPGTAALLALGGLAMLARRKRPRHAG